MSLGDRIDCVLKQYPQGIKAIKIAFELSVSRNEVNSYLYSNRKSGKYILDEEYRWKLAEYNDMYLKKVTEKEKTICKEIEEMLLI